MAPCFRTGGSIYTGRVALCHRTDGSTGPGIFMLKDLLGDTLQGMLEAEMDEKLGYSKYDYKNKDTDDSRNGYSPKTVTSSMGPIDLDIPRDRKGEFEPQIVKKNQTDISNIEDQVLSMYAKGMTTRDISTHLRDVYGVDASAEMISHMTDRILPIAKEWQNRPLERKYAIVFMDAVHFHVREDNRTIKKAVYVAIGTRLDGTREVLGMWIGGNESAKYWLGVLNEIRNRGVEDIMIVSVDGLTGFGDAINAVFPKAEIQRCIVHQIRYSTKFISYKDIKPFMKDLALVYKADKSIVPEEADRKARSNKPVYATMRKGETLEEMAKRNYTTVEKLRALNPDISKFKSGTRLRVR